MSRLTIAGNFPLPAKVALGDELVISGTFTVYAAYVDQIDITGPADTEPQYVNGETQLEATSNSIKVAAA